MYSALITFFARYAIFFFVIPIILLWKDGLKTKVVKAIFAISLAIAISEFTKYLFPSTRPDHLGSILGNVEGGSFPSSHTAAAFAISTIIFFYEKRLGIFSYAISILIGLARVLGGVHYTADVLVGGFLGLIIGNLVYKLAIYLKRR